MTERPRVTAVMLAYGDEPVLVEAVESVLASTDVDLDVVLVDNGCTDGSVERLRGRDGITVLTPSENTGFAGGCNLGADSAAGDFLVFVNGDAVAEPPAVSRLVAALDGAVALASGSVRLYDEPEVINTVGNPIHFSGLSWAGGLGEPASAHATATEIASATGCALAVSAERFHQLGGFCTEMFAYCEDSDLSLRAWQRGWRVMYVPDAVVRHRYEFSRNPLKLYLLERNRLFMLLTLFELRTLIVLAPALLGLEAAILAVAARQGWARQKLDGYRWLWRNRRLISGRRRDVQAVRARSDADLARLITGDFAPGESTGLAVGGVPRAISRAYWSLARRLLG